MMRRPSIWILLSLLFCCAAGLQAAAGNTAPQVVSAVPAGDALLTPWQPSLSYESGRQYDARLEKPVQEWRVGVPLRDLLADLTRQTGVAFGFYPPDTEDARACVTLFLNPQQPPELRSVMVQLAWVTGATFGYAEDAAGAHTYYLLGTTQGVGVADKLAAQTAEQRAQFQTDVQNRMAQQRDATAQLLAEARQALTLSSAEAIARYRGTNDALLLNLLDPTRRAAMAVVTTLPESDQGQLLGGGGPRGGGLTRAWSDWSPDQQAALTQALGLGKSLPKGTIISIQGGRGGMVSAMVPNPDGGRPQMLGRVGGILASGNLRGRQQTALQGYLGAAPTPTPAQTPVDRQAARTARQQQQAQRATQAQADARTLSKEEEAALAALVLPEGSGRGELWQLQETVAKASGRSIIADTYWPPFGGGGGFGRGGRGGGAQSAAHPVSALDALSAACAPRAGGFGRGGPGMGPGAAGADLSVSWGEAGDFLRFRSKSPEVWRAAALPVEVQTQLDAWLAPYVDAETPATQPAAAGPGGRRGPGANAPLADDLEKMSWLAGRLNDLQIQMGGSVVYGELTDAKEARRQALRRGTLQQLAMRLPLFRLTATFSPEQWTQARGEGLHWSTDLTPNQQSTDLSRMFGRGVPAERANDVVLRLGQTEARTINGPNGNSFTIPAATALEIVLDGQVVSTIPFSGFGGGGPGGGFGGPGGGGGRGRGGGGRGGGGG